MASSTLQRAEGRDVTPLFRLFVPLGPRPAGAAHLHGHELPASALLRAQPGVGARGDPLRLPLKLLPGRQPPLGETAVVDGGPHRASGFGLVPAVAEATLRDERLDVAERPLESLLTDPQPGAAQPRGVEQYAATGQHHQLARRRGVPALAVAA